MTKHVDNIFCLMLLSVRPTPQEMEKQDMDMHIESNRVQFNGTRVVPSGEALRNEAIKREEDC